MFCNVHIKDCVLFYAGTCRKMCDAANVDSIQSAQRLKGCVIINGSLEIQIRGGGNGITKVYLSC